MARRRRPPVSMMANRAPGCDLAAHRCLSWWTRCPCNVGVLFLREQMGTSREGRFSNATEANWTLPSSGERDLLGA